MILFLFIDNERTLLEDDSLTLEEYNALPNFTLEITDTNDSSLVATDLLVSEKSQVKPVEGKADAGFAAFRSAKQKPKTAAGACIMNFTSCPFNLLHLQITPYSGH
jgi:hypothetical protein